MTIKIKNILTIRSNPKVLTWILFALSLSLTSCAEDANSGSQNKTSKLAPQQDALDLDTEATTDQTLALIAKSDLSPDAIKQMLEKTLPGIGVTDVELSPMKNAYQVFYNGQMLYVSTDGKFLMTGNLLEIRNGQPVNHTELSMAKKASEAAPERAKTVAELSEDDMVVFKAKDEKYAITVFTDVDCAYCRKLHKEVPQLNASGITVRYLAFPRAGLGSSAHKKLVSVWCAKDKMQAMNDAKLKRKFSDASCENPLDSQYQLTRELGLSGTPALILPDGELIAGYVPHKDLIKHLESKMLN